MKHNETQNRSLRNLDSLPHGRFHLNMNRGNLGALARSVVEQERNWITSTERPHGIVTVLRQVWTPGAEAKRS